MANHVLHEPVSNTRLITILLWCCTLSDTRLIYAVITYSDFYGSRVWEQNRDHGDLRAHIQRNQNMQLSYPYINERNYFVLSKVITNPLNTNVHKCWFNIWPTSQTVVHSSQNKTTLRQNIVFAGTSKISQIFKRVWNTSNGQCWSVVCAKLGVIRK